MRLISWHVSQITHISQCCSDDDDNVTILFFSFYDKNYLHCRHAFTSL